MPIRIRILTALAPLARPARAVIALAAVGLGVALILAPLTPQQTAVVTGLGVAVLGLGALLLPAPDAALRLPARVLGAASIVAGAVVALWPGASAPGLALVVGIALVAHGLLRAVQAVLGRGEARVTSVIAALAGIVLGVVALSWPVLTLTVFRLGVGAFLVFQGLALLLALLGDSRRSARAEAASDHAPDPAPDPAGTLVPDPAAALVPDPAADPAATPVPRSRPRGRVARWGRALGASLALVASLALALGTGWALGGVPLPEPGAFYTPPSAVPSEPGRLIRSEPLTTGVPRGAEAWRILYTTTGVAGEPAVSSGTVVAPAQRGDAPLPLLSVAHGTTGVAPKCAPSLSATPFADGAGAALSTLVTEHGWAAVTSDYIGLGTAGPHPYLIGDAEGRNVLDATRAARELDGLRLPAKTVVWGHSQGGQGSLWTGQIAPDYAPELEIAGIAAFAPAANLYGLAEVTKNEAAGKTVSAYIAATWDEIFPELGLADELTPGSAGGVAKISQLCFNGQDALAAILRGTQVPSQIFPDRVLAGEFGRTLRAQTPTGPFPAPVLVAQGLADPLVQPAQQEQWVAGRCAAGVPLDFRTYPGLDHLSLVAADSPLTPELVSWTLDRWAGAPANDTCGATAPPNAEEGS